MEQTIKQKEFISTQAAKIEGSITMAISALAKSMKDEGKDVLSFSAGEPDFPTPERISNAGIQAIKDGQTTYTAASGMPSLRQAISGKIKRDLNIDYSADEIVVSCGAKHSIYNCLYAVINPGDEVLIPAPYWVSYPSQVQLVGGEPVILETTEASSFKITAEQLANAITEKTKLLILNSPSNPTGSVYSREELEALAQVIVEKKILVLSDEIYAKLVYGAAQHTSIASISSQIKDLTLLVDGASKAYSMTGWRIGYVAGPKSIIQVMNRMQSHSTSNPTTPSQFAALEAFSGGDEDVNEMKVAFEKRRQYMYDALNQIPGISCIMPDGAFYMFVNISACFGKACSSGTITGSLDFCEYLLKEAEVALIPGAAFGSNDFVRMSYATSPEVIEQGIQRILNWVSSLT